MKNVFLKSVLVLTTVLFFITGCSNFLGGSELKQDISYAIDYANAEDCSFYLKADNNNGSFLTEGKITGKVGYPVEIQFSVNSSEYVFNRFVAVDSSAPEISKNNIVKFELTSIPDEISKGIYKANVTLLKADANVLVKADCNLIPKIIKVYPPFTPSGYDQDTTIQFTFNKSMDTCLLQDFSKIKITSGEKNLLAENDSYFEAPFFTDNNQVLNIPTKKGKVILSSVDPVATLDITVELNLNQISDEENKLTLSGTYTHTYRINTKVDEIPPEMELKLYNTNDSENPYYHELTEKAFDLWKNTLNSVDVSPYYRSDYSQNHVSKIYITVFASDKNSGVDRVRVTEQRVKNKNGKDVTDNLYSNDFGSGQFVPYLDENGNQIYNQNGVPVYTYSFIYNFFSDDDGLVNLNISVFDKANKECSSVLYSVIKDNANEGVSLINNTNTRTNNGVTIDDFSRAVLNEKTGIYEGKTFFYDFSIDNNRFYSLYYTTKKISIEIWNEGEKACQLYDKETLTPANKNPTTLDIKDSLNSKIEASGFVRNSKKDCYMKVTIWSENTQVNETIYTIPAQVSFVEMNESTKTLKMYNYKANHGQYFVYSYQEDENTKPEFTLYSDTRFVYNYWDVTKLLTKNGIYNFYVSTDYDNGLISNLGDPFVFYYGITAPDNNTTVSFPDFSIDETNIQYPQNTSNAIVEVTVDYLNKDGISYYIKDAYNSETYYYSKSVITISNGYSHTISLIAKDSDGNFLGESDKKISLELNKVDNFPPYTALLFNQQYYPTDKPNEIVLTSNYPAFQDIVENRSVSNSITDFTYYFVPESYGTKITYNFIKDNFTGYKCTYDGTSTKISFPFNGIDEGYYNLFYFVTDSSELKNFNFSYIATNMSKILHATTEKSPDFSYVNETEPSIKFSIPTYSKDTYKYDLTTGGVKAIEILIYYYLENNKWVKGSMEKNYSGLGHKEMSKNAATGMSELSIPMTTFNNHDFIMVNTKVKEFYPRSGNYSLDFNSESIFYNPVIICPEYLAGNIQCLSKGYMKVANGTQYFVDAPCLVHILYCAKKLTETNTTEDAEKWLTNGQETGIFSAKSMFTYPDSMYDSVPEGAYYTTISHFADGTFEMSEVKQN